MPMSPAYKAQVKKRDEARKSIVHLFTLLSDMEINNDAIMIRRLMNRTEIIIMERVIRLYIKNNLPDYIVGKYE